MDYQEHQVDQVNLALQENQDRQGHQVKEEKQDHLVFQVLASLDMMVYLVNKDFQEERERKAHQVFQGGQAYLAMENQDIPGQRVRKDTVVFLVFRAQKVTKVM